MSDGKVASTIVGFSHPIIGAIENNVNEVINHLDVEGRVIQHIDAPEQLGALGCSFVEIIPPLSEREMKKFASVCLKLVTTGNNSVSVIDNRGAVPERSTQIAGTIIAWI